MDSGAPSRTLKKTGTFIFVRELQFSMLIGLLFNMSVNTLSKLGMGQISHDGDSSFISHCVAAD